MAPPKTKQHKAKAFRRLTFIHLLYLPADYNWRLGRVVE